MMHVPTEIAICAAEMRIAQSKRNTQESLSRARLAFRANLVRPSTLAVAAGAAGLLGFWLARRPRTQAASASDGKRVAGTPSMAVIVRGFIVRYAMKALPLVWQQVRAAGQEQAARAHSETPKPHAEDPLTSGMRNQEAAR
jgi:hypothetical protein